MTPRRAKNPPAAGARRPPSAATVGFEPKLWAAADALRNNMDAAGQAKIGRTMNCSQAWRAPPSPTKAA